MPETAKGWLKLEAGLGVRPQRGVRQYVIPSCGWADPVRKPETCGPRGGLMAFTRNAENSKSGGGRWSLGAGEGSGEGQLMGTASPFGRMGTFCNRTEVVVQ